VSTNLASLARSEIITWGEPCVSLLSQLMLFLLGCLCCEGGCDRRCVSCQDHEALEALCVCGGGYMCHMRRRMHVSAVKTMRLLRLYVCVCMCAYKHRHTRVGTHTHKHVCVCVCAYMGYIYIYIYVYNQRYKMRLRRNHE
jgi:hypothetical protein